VPNVQQSIKRDGKKSLRPVSVALKKLNVKVLLDLHLDPNHMAFMLFEAPTAEAVRDLVTMAGFVYFLDFNFHLATPISDILKNVDEIPTIF
jgi:hypothetical protein